MIHILQAKRLPIRNEMIDKFHIAFAASNKAISITSSDSLSGKLKSILMPLIKNFRSTKSDILYISGWIIGKKNSIDLIQLRFNGAVIQTLNVDIPRPDVLQAYPEGGTENNFGFAAYIHPLFLPEAFKLEIFAISKDGGETKIAMLDGSRSKMLCKFETFIFPVALTSLGRSGSAAMLGLISAHPEIVEYNPFKVEARYMTYWFQMLTSLSSPNSWINPVGCFDMRTPDWIYGENLTAPLHSQIYPEVMDWFGKDYLPELINFCTNSLNQHYMKVALAQQKINAKFYIEKVIPNPHTGTLLQLIPGGREVFLVRDFRDMLCSMIAFNKKLGGNSFGINAHSSEKEYISTYIKMIVSQIATAWKQRGDESLLVKYENLVRSPEDTCKQIFEHLGINSSDATIANAIETFRAANPKSQKKHATTTNPVKSIGRYKENLSTEIIDHCNSVLRDELKFFGYTS